MAKEEIIGSPRRNLVFETSGVIRVKVGDKYYKLNYDKETTDDEDEESIESKIIYYYMRQDSMNILEIEK